MGVRMIGVVAGPGRGGVVAEGTPGGVVIVPGVPGVTGASVGEGVASGGSGFLNGSSHTCSA